MNGLRFLRYLFLGLVFGFSGEVRVFGQYNMPPQAMPPAHVVDTPYLMGPTGGGQASGWAPVANPLDPGAFANNPAPYSFQWVPTGFVWREYLASPIASRMASPWVYTTNLDTVFWQPMVGGKFGLFRYGTEEAERPSGFQFDMEGVALPRLSSSSGDLISSDYRVVLPLTYREGAWEGRFGYEHYCSHLGDEYLIANPTAKRDNYVRNAVLLGVGFRPLPEVRLYGEASWAFTIDGQARPWQFEFGTEYSSWERSPWYGKPYLAVNARLRQEVDFGGSLNAQTGLQWRGANGQLLRLGATYMNGMSDQVQFSNQWEQQIGLGLWYDY